MPRILCIDDYEPGLLTRKAFLETFGFEVITATSGAEGLDLLSRGGVDLVILDYQMPGEDGGLVASRMRQLAPGVPILMLSGFPRLIPLSIMKLVDAFLEKGLSPRENLLPVVHELLARKQAASPAQPLERRPITVLNVDDNEAQRYAVSRILRKAGFEVIEASTGSDTLTLAQQRPDIIILDVHLPDIDGPEVCRRIKANPSTSSIPVVHLSATATSDEASRRGLRSGAARYLTHPIAPKDLISTLRDIASRG